MPVPKGDKKSDARRASQNKYDLKNLAVLACKVRKPEAEAFRALCEAHGLTVNAALSDYVHNSLDGCALLESLATAENKRGYNSSKID